MKREKRMSSWLAWKGGLLLLMILIMGTAGAGSVNAAVMDGRWEGAGSFDAGWWATSPDLATVTQLYFDTSGVNYTLTASTVKNAMAWDGTGTQPNYTIDTTTLTTNYGLHVGGSSDSVLVGNYGSYSGGLGFLTFYVDAIPGSTTDVVTFNITSETILMQNSSMLMLQLIGTASDADGYWYNSNAYAYLLADTSGNYQVAWSSIYTTPEPAAVLLFGLGLALTFLYIRKRQGMRI